jgi:hypothetical protein
MTPRVDGDVIDPGSDVPEVNNSLSDGVAWLD